MLGILIRKQLFEAFKGYFYDSKKNKARTKAGTVFMILLYIVLMFGVVGGMFTGLAVTICEVMAEAGMTWFYFLLFGMISVLMGTFAGVFITYSSLYKAKDNELLMAMPIPEYVIVASRLINVYLLGALYASVVFLPAVIVYIIYAGCSASLVLGWIVMFLEITVAAMCLSCLLGWFVAKISSRLKNKSIVKTLLSLLFIGLYYFCYFRAQLLIQELLVNIVLYGGKIEGSARFLYYWGLTAEGNLWSIVVGLLLSVLLSGLIWRLLSRSFFELAASSDHFGKVVYREKKFIRNSTDSALLKREFERFLSSSAYMLNCGLGTVFMIVLAGALLLKGTATIEVIREIFGTDAPVLLFMLAAIFMSETMNDVTAPSVSLEGKNLWIVQTLPVEAWDVLKAKLKMAVLLTGIPVLFCSLAAIWVMKPSAAELILLLILPQLFGFFLSAFGLFMGLKMPNLTWTDEIAVIKRSGTVVIALFGGWALVIVLVVLYLLAGDVLGLIGYLSVSSLLLCLADLGLVCWLKHQGAGILRRL